VERYLIHFGSGLASVTKRYSSVVLDSFERANKIYTMEASGQLNPVLVG